MPHRSVAAPWLQRATSHGLIDLKASPPDGPECTGVSLSYLEALLTSFTQTAKVDERSSTRDIMYGIMMPSLAQPLGKGRWAPAGLPVCY